MKRENTHSRIKIHLNLVVIIIKSSMLGTNVGTTPLDLTNNFANVFKWINFSFMILTQIPHIFHLKVQSWKYYKGD